MERGCVDRIQYFSCWTAVRLKSFVSDHAGILLLLLGIVLLNVGMSEIAAAQNGGEIFQDATVNLACKVLPGKFGAMLTAFTGMFALIAAATGAYRGAWALLFVSVGCYIAKELVGVLFGDVNC
jgi:hypothetical protein